MKEIMLIILILMALIIVQTQRLRIAVIFLGVFSLVIALVYLLQGAPDVAIAEAIIGSTMSTILFIVALQKYKLVKIYVVVDGTHMDDKVYKEKVNGDILSKIRLFCFKNNLEPMTIYTLDTSNLNGHHHNVVLKTLDDSYTLQYHDEYIKGHELYNYLKTYPEYKELKKDVIL